MKISFVRPAMGEYLVARGVAISAGRTQSVARSEIFAVENEIERLCAAAQGTITVTRPSQN